MPKEPSSDGGSSEVEAVCGTIEEALPSALFRVTLDVGRTITAGLSVEARRVLIKVVPGDRVRVAPSPFDPTRGKIVGRCR